MLEHESSMWISWWGESDLVVRGVFVTLVTLSLLSWTVILYKVLLFNKLARMEAAITRFLNGQAAETDPLPAAASLTLTTQVAKLGREEHEAARSDGLTRQRLELENQLALLATVGNTAPFIGLLGTVWGIMHALQNMGGSAGISLDTVAGPVGEALVATAMGLFAAIPAVAGYNLLIRRLRKLHTVIEVNSRGLLRRGPVVMEGLTS